MAELLALHVADPPELWRTLGFAITGSDATAVGGVELQLGVTGHGVVAWSLEGAEPLTELLRLPAPLRVVDDRTTTHRNGVTEIDHVVVATPDLQRTITAFETAGLALRRTREASPNMTQAFFKLGPVVIEVVGSPVTAGEGPATIWGITFTVADLDATSAYLGDALRPAKTAVQTGRRIATLDRAAGSTVPIAFMSPHTGT